MKLDFDTDGSRYVIRGYDDDGVVINEQRYRHSVIVTPAKLIAHWPPTSLDELRSEHMGAIIELEPDYVAAHTALGEVALKAGPLKDAVARFRAALEIEPTCPGLHARLGEALLRQGRLAEAKRHLSVDPERNPAHAQALMTLGNCLLEMGRPTAASYCFRRLLNNQPDAPGPHHNLAVCSFINGKFDEGIEQIGRAHV